MSKSNSIKRIEIPDTKNIVDTVNELVDAVNEIYKRFHKASESMKKYQFETKTPKRSKNV